MLTGLRRGKGLDPRFWEAVSTRQFLVELEATDADQPLTLAEDLLVLKEAGLTDSAVLWSEYREVVIGGRKQLIARRGSAGPQ